MRPATECVRLRSVLAVVLAASACLSARAAELPPEILADRYLVQAERQLGAGQGAAAVATLDRILALREDHGLEIPAAFWFRHAQASLDAGLFDQAASSATDYLRQAGRQGEYYLEALRLLDAAVAGKETEPGRTFRDALASGSEGPEMVVVPAGRFRMGCLSNDHECYDWEKPVREVVIPAPFALSVHEVTFEDYDRFTYPNKVDDEGWGRGRRPVINVSWDDAREYVAWLSSQTGAEYRLPSEAEWEYAARAGTTTKYSWGNGIGVNRANCDGDYCGDQWEYTAPVGSFRANGFGLHDMHGNVFEWVADCWNRGYAGAPTDGNAWLSGDCADRVARSGSWNFDPRNIRAAFRLWNTAGVRSGRLGFRVARTLAP